MIVHNALHTSLYPSEPYLLGTITPVITRNGTVVSNGVGLHSEPFYTYFGTNIINSAGLSQADFACGEAVVTGGA